MAQTVSPYASASLYVGDLPPDATESNLFEIFNRIGSVSSIRVCRDVVTRRSLGYAYVNFHNPPDAERAIEELKDTRIKNKPIRVMWSQRDPSLRKSNVGNVFIKNLEESIDSRSLTEACSTFGPILSCKVATDEHGRSKGYGFVHFGTAEAAKRVIDELNEKQMNGKTVTVTKFIPKKDRDNRSGFTNVYINNLEANIDDTFLRKHFGQFGSITSIYISGVQADTNTKYAFINFESPADAQKVVDTKNGSQLSEKIIYVGRAKKKTERQQEIQEKLMHTKPATSSLNLYVKNLADDVDSERLRAIFQPYGPLGSVEVMRDDKGTHKGFGFVCFKSQDAGTRALHELHGYVVSNKPLYIAVAQKKEERRAHLVATRTKVHPGAAAAMFPPTMPPVYYAGAPHAPPQSFFPNPFPPVRNRWPGNIPPATYHQAQPPMNNYNMNMNPNPSRGSRPRGSARRYANVPANQHHAQPGHQNVNPAVQNQRGARVDGIQNQQGPNVPESAEYITPSEKSNSEQIEAASEKLYELVCQEQPNWGSKITGMLLDRVLNHGNGLPDLLHLLDTPSLLTDQINEAVEVLRTHNVPLDQ